MEIGDGGSLLVNLVRKNKRVLEGHAKPSFKVYKRANDRILLWAPQCMDCGLLSVGNLSKNWIDVIGCSLI